MNFDSSSSLHPTPHSSSQLEKSAPHPGLQVFNLNAFVFQQTEVGKKQKTFSQENAEKKQRKKRKRWLNQRRFTSSSLIPNQSQDADFFKRAIPLFETLRTRLFRRRFLASKHYFWHYSCSFKKFCLSVVKLKDEVKRRCKPAINRNRDYQLTDEEISIGYVHSLRAR